jgi:UPF0042 nucleotide-binding protein
MNGEDQFATTGQCAPLIFDARCIDNPHQDKNLRKLTGKDAAVQRAVWADPQAKKMVREAAAYLRANPTGYVAFGCSYGKHRSVALAEMTADFLQEQMVMIVHTGAISKGKNK